jgi:hypothetical protein
MLMADLMSYAIADLRSHEIGRAAELTSTK